MSVLRLKEHAFNRCRERLSLSPQAVLDLLGRDRAVPIGRDPDKKQKIHLLFYSSPDNYYFVAVKDSTTNEIVTILPIDYHNRWKVDHAAQRQARLLIEPECVPETISLTAPTRSDIPHLVAEEGDTHCNIRITYLGSVTFTLESIPVAVGQSLEELFADVTLICALKERMVQCVGNMSYIRCIHAQFVGTRKMQRKAKKIPLRLFV